MGQARTYTDEFKAQALKLAKEIGTKRATEKLGVPKNTLGTLGDYAKLFWQNHSTKFKPKDL